MLRRLNVYGQNERLVFHRSLSPSPCGSRLIAEPKFSMKENFGGSLGKS